MRERKDPAERRAEIVSVAAGLARADGLDAITLRRVAGVLGVTNSLVSHYFPNAELLVAEAFGSLAGADLAEHFTLVWQSTDPVDRLRVLLRGWITEDTEPAGAIWLDAWSHARVNSHLRDQVNRQMLDGHRRVVELLGSGDWPGVDVDVDAVAWRLLTLLDGVIVHVTLRVNVVVADTHRAVAAMLENSLGLASGALQR